MKKLFKAKTATKGKTTRSGGLAAKVGAVAKSNGKKEFPNFRAGDTLRVHVRIKEGDKERVQAYEGDCIKIGNHGAGKSFTVRKISHGVGVERVFLYNSPKVAKVEIVSEGSVARAKLYYLRKLEGKAARIDRNVQSNEAKAASAASKSE